MVQFALRRSHIVAAAAMTAGWLPPPCSAGRALRLIPVVASSCFTPLLIVAARASLGPSVGGGGFRGAVLLSSVLSYPSWLRACEFPASSFGSAAAPVGVLGGAPMGRPCGNFDLSGGGGALGGLRGALP